MLLALVLALEQSSVVIQLALKRMMMVRWMMSEGRLMELGHRILAVVVRLPLTEHWLVLDHEPLVAVAQFLFARDVHRSLRHLPELHLLDLLVHLVCHQYCPRLVAVQIVTCLVQGFGSFGKLLFLPLRQRWSEYSQPCWLRLEEG